MTVDFTFIAPDEQTVPVFDRSIWNKRSPEADGFSCSSCLGDNMFNMFNQISDTQPGDPAKGGQRVIKAVTHTGYAAGKKLPGRLILGRDAYGFVGEAMKQWEEDRQDWKDWAFDSWRDDVPLPEGDETNMPR
jgi:hypothetical protein